MRKTLCILIAVSMLISCAVLPLSAGEESLIPTLYVDNEVWYKYLLYPLIQNDGEYCIPVSMLQATNEISYRYDEKTECLLISGEDGKYLSVRPGDSICIDDSGTRSEIVSFVRDKEIYLSSEKLASVFGIVFEITEYQGQKMLRLCTSDDLLPFDYVIKANMTGGSEFSDHTASQDEEIIKYGSTFSVIADITDMHIDTITEILDMADSLSVTLTFAMTSEFIMGDHNLPLLSQIASHGHTFALVIDPASDVSPKKQYDNFSDRLLLIFREKSNLVIGEKVKALTDKKCVYLENITLTSDITSVSSYDYAKKPFAMIKSDDQKELSLLTALIMNAPKAGYTVTSVNPHTGA